MLILLLVLSSSFADDVTYPLATCATIPSGPEHDKCVDAAIAEIRLREQGGATTVTAGPQGLRGKPGKNGTNGTNGTNGKSTLSSSVPEVAGPHCPGGGFKIGTGLDVNGDKALQISEVVTTYYVCNGTNGTDGINGRDASPVRLAVTGAGGVLLLDDPHLEGTHFEALWTSGVSISASQLKPSGFGWEASATIFVAGSASAGAGGGAGLFYGGDRGRIGLRIDYLHLEPNYLLSGIVPFKFDAGGARLFVEFNPGEGDRFFLTGSVGACGGLIADGSGSLLSGAPVVAAAGAGWRFF